MSQLNHIACCDAMELVAFNNNSFVAGVLEYFSGDDASELIPFLISELFIDVALGFGWL